MFLTMVLARALGEGEPATLQELECVAIRFIPTILGFAGIALFIMLVVGGYQFISAGGNPKHAETGKATITYAILGMVLLAASFMILQFFTLFTGVDVTNFDVAVGRAPAGCKGVVGGGVK